VKNEEKAFLKPFTASPATLFLFSFFYFRSFSPFRPLAGYWGREEEGRGKKKNEDGTFDACLNASPADLFKFSLFNFRSFFPFPSPCGELGVNHW